MSANHPWYRLGVNQRRVLRFISNSPIGFAPLYASMKPLIRYNEDQFRTILTSMVKKEILFERNGEYSKGLRWDELIMKIGAP